ncbi:MAG: hypothetical protein LBM99_04785, partial [Bacillales bacterium]|nr:hypothetical protein [Bacillales bacterium]
MNTKILKLKIEGIKNFKDNTFFVDFTNITNIRGNDWELFNCGNGIYTNNIIAFSGPNASGKTT